MARRAPAQKPSSMEFLEMISGPKVDLYVGPKEKHYRLPKLLLCHYSEYFDRCFNGNFAEAKSQRLNLSEDRVEDFEILLEYMLRGTAGQSLEVSETGGLAVQRCMDFIEYADKYNLAEAAQVVYEPLKKALQAPLPEVTLTFKAATLSRVREPRILPADVELIFRVMPVDSPLRTLVAQGALSHNGMRVGYEKQEKQVEGFAAELLSQIRASIKSGLRWMDPVTGEQRTW